MIVDWLQDWKQQLFRHCQGFFPPEIPPLLTLRGTDWTTTWWNITPPLIKKNSTTFEGKWTTTWKYRHFWGELKYNSPPDKIQDTPAKFKILFVLMTGSKTKQWMQNWGLPNGRGGRIVTCHARGGLQAKKSDIWNNRARQTPNRRWGGNILRLWVMGVWLNMVTLQPESLVWLNMVREPESLTKTSGSIYSLFAARIPLTSSLQAKMCDNLFCQHKNWLQNCRVPKFVC